MTTWMRGVEKQFIKLQPYWNSYKRQTNLCWIMLRMCDDLTVCSTCYQVEVGNWINSLMWWKKLLHKWDSKPYFLTSYCFEDFRTISIRTWHQMLISAPILFELYHQFLSFKMMTLVQFLNTVICGIQKKKKNCKWIWANAELFPFVLQEGFQNNIIFREKH